MSSMDAIGSRLCWHVRASEAVTYKAKRKRETISFLESGWLYSQSKAEQRKDTSTLVQDLPFANIAYNINAT